MSSLFLQYLVDPLHVGEARLNDEDYKAAHSVRKNWTASENGDRYVQLFRCVHVLLTVVRTVLKTQLKQLNRTEKRG